MNAPTYEPRPRRRGVPEGKYEKASALLAVRCLPSEKEAIERFAARRNEYVSRVVLEAVFAGMAKGGAE